MVLDVVRIKGRWQDDYFLRTGHLATLKGASNENVQIPQELFMKLLRYHLLDDDSCTEEVKNGLEQKMNAMVERELYTRSKTAPTEEEREKARQEYLDRRGIPEDFRW